jgi:hypothetical protein
MENNLRGKHTPYLLSGGVYIILMMQSPHLLFLGKLETADKKLS